MTERLTLKKLSGEIETLRARVLRLEQQLEQNIETTLKKAVTQPGYGIDSGQAAEHGTGIGAAHRRRLIEQEAYLIAERRGFQGGDPAQDWAAAEKLVNDRLMRGTSRVKSTSPSNKAAIAKVPAETSRPANKRSTKRAS